MDVDFERDNNITPPGKIPWLFLVIIILLISVFAFRFFSGKPKPSFQTEANVPEVNKTKVSSVKSITAEKIEEVKSVTNVVSKKAVQIKETPKDEIRNTGLKIEESKKGIQDVKVTTSSEIDSITLMFDEVQKVYKEGNLIQARSICYKILQKKDIPEDIKDKVGNILGSININLLFSPSPIEEKVEYVVKKGDSLEAIARKFGTTVELIQRSNNIKNPARIMPGDLLRVLSGKFSIIVNKSRHEMILYLNGRFFKKYIVGLGAYDRTPEGTFVIDIKEKNPDWWKDGRLIKYTGDPKGENILGTRWLGLKATGQTPAVSGYGIHGTWDDTTIGKSVTAGCIRMYNKDVEEIFDILPVGVFVKIVRE